MADERAEPASDLDVRLQVLAELRGVLREAVSVCDLAVERLRVAKSVAEQERIGEDVEGFFRRVGLATLALGSPSLASTGNGSSVNPDERK